MENFEETVVDCWDAHEKVDWRDAWSGLGKVEVIPVAKAVPNLFTGEGEGVGDLGTG